VLSPLGAGGMGEVYRARDTRLDRNVAIKVLPAEFANNEQLRIRFEREARTISQLNHPHICTLHDVGQFEGNDYLVMELLEGESLADRIERGALPLSEVLKIGVQIADALDRAHRAGIVHRDLKPGNVMLTKTGAKLLDFGLAKSSGIGFSADAVTVQRPLTQEGSILGTFQYMAPEQIEGLEADTRSDIFAFGAVMYEMTTGQRAFEGSTKTSLIAAIVSKDPKPLAQVQPLTPPALEHVIAKCLAKDADDRWQSAHDIAEELRWISEAGSQAGVATTISVRKKTREKVAWGVATALALFAVAITFLYGRAVQRAQRSFVTDLAPPAGVLYNAVGDESGALVVSPDGTMAVFSGSNGAQRLLYLRSLTTGESKAIGGSEGGMFPFWSPDSRKIGFFSMTAIKRVDVSGGSPSVVVPSAAVSAGSARGGVWTPDDWIIWTPNTQAPLMKVRANGGPTSNLTRLVAAKHTSHRWPSMMPDGKHLIYLAANHQNPTGGDNGIYMTSTDGEEPKLVTQSTSSGVYADGYLLFARDQTLLAQKMSTSGVVSGDPIPIAENVLDDTGIWRGAFSVSKDHLLTFHTGRASVTSELRWVDRGGKELQKIGTPASYWDLELSRNGQKVAVEIGDPLRELWIVDLARNTRTRLPLDSAWVGTAVFSPDSSMIYTSILRQGHGALIVHGVSGGVEKKLRDGDVSDGGVSSISPDGKSLLFVRTDGLVLLPVADPARETKLGGHTNDSFGEFSPDGRYITYMSDQNGRMEAFITAVADPNQKWQVSNNGGFYPRWRSDGKEVFYLDPSNKLNAVSVETNGSDLSLGTPEPLFSIVPRPQCRPYAVSADGQKFLVNTLVEQSSPTVTVVSNWMSRLRK
ncbi:MAG TPA: protein kinase, partial [Thermoanaerobaculia bacterium]